MSIPGALTGLLYSIQNFKLKPIVCKVVTPNGMLSSFMTEQDKTSICKELVIVSPSSLRWNLSDFVYHPEFNLGIVEEWLPKHPVARVSTSIDVLNQDNLTNDDDAEFWQSIGIIKDRQLIEIIADKQLVSPLEEVPIVLAPKQSKTGHNPKLVEWMQSLLNYHCHSRSLTAIVTWSHGLIDR